MTWNAPKSWVVGDGPWTAGIMNTYARDNLKYARDTIRVEIFSGALADDTVTTDVYHGVPNMACRFRKKYASTHFKFNLECEAWSEVANSAVQFGVNVEGGGSNFVVDGRPHYFNVANEVHYCYGGVLWGGPQPPGLYKILGLYMLRSGFGAGPGPIHVSSGLRGTLEVSEISVE